MSMTISVLGRDFQKNVLDRVHPIIYYNAIKKRNCPFHSSCPDRENIYEESSGLDFRDHSPRYAANVEGGGGKVLLMPSGHDTLNLNTESRIRYLRVMLLLLHGIIER